MKNKKYILKIILLLICILFAYTTYTRWLRYEGFRITCTGGQQLVSGVCVCPDRQTLIDDECECSDPAQIKNDSGVCVCSNANYIISNMSNICIPNIITANTDVRSDYTCSDGQQKNTFDRFNGAVYADMTKKVNSNFGPCTYESSNNGFKYNHVPYYFGHSNLCLRECPSNYSISAKDNTLCVANSCYNTLDLSENILDSWRQVCGPLYKTQLNFTSTLNSISSVRGDLTDQYKTATTNVTLLSNGMWDSGTNVAIRDLRYPSIQSNYNTMASIISDTNSNYMKISGTKSNFDSYYYSFLCDRYY